jgi:hypothetical protein
LERHRCDLLIHVFILLLGAKSAQTEVHQGNTCSVCSDKYSLTIISPARSVSVYQVKVLLNI